jgi:hypothetical protein
MRFRLLAAVFAVSLVATAQQSLSVEQLASFLRSSVSLKQSDREVASYVSRVKLSQRLDDRAIEEMQGYGIGPKTLQALQALRDRTQALAASQPLEPPVQPRLKPPPSSEEQAAIVSDMREYALSYSRNLPDFICTQVTRRYAAARPGTRYGGPAGHSPSWQKLDELTIRLSYFGQKEDYKLILVNSTPASQDYRNLGGSTSYGDFGSMMKQIFEPATQARFEWDHWGTLRTQPVMAFAYHVEQARSQWHVVVKESGQDVVPAYHGLVYVDPQAHAILRVTLEAEGLPPAFPVKNVKEVLDYDFQEISGRNFLLPLKGEVDMDASDFLTMNILEFHMYRKYSAESEIKYDADIGAAPPPPPISDDKTKETPAVDCKDPKNKDLKECIAR